MEEMTSCALPELVSVTECDVGTPIVWLPNPMFVVESTAVGAEGPKNSPMPVAMAVYPGRCVIPSARRIVRSVSS
jgi:hypothetical protein